jgi:hypothetical protein
MNVKVVLLAFVGVIGAAAAHAATVDDLRWMAGSWASDSGGVRIEEHWTAPAGGLMVGMHRDVIGGRATGFEFARIRADSAGLVLLAQPGGRPPHPFRLKESGARRVVFEDPEHDFPQRVMYWLDTRGRLHARVEGMMDGKLEGENWCWKKASLLEPVAKRRR